MTARQLGLFLIGQAVDPWREGKRRAERWLEALVVTAAAVLIAALRWFVTRHRIVFELRSDEAGQLGFARTISGGEPWNMLSNVTWRPGYGALLAPFNWLFDDPVSVYRAALVTNAVLGGLAFVLVAWLVREVLATNWLWSTLVAFVASLLPGALLVTNWVWSESLVSVMYLASVIAAIRCFRQPSPARSVVLLMTGVMGYLTHGRLSPLVVVALAVLATVAVQGRLGRRLATGLAAAALVVTLLVDWLIGQLIELIWTRARPTNSPGAVIDNVVEFRGLIGSTAGQIWYQQVSTAGVWAVGVVAVAAIAIGRFGARTDAARIVLLAYVPIAVLGFLFLAETPQARSDYVVYGRYLDAVSGPVVAVGLATVLVGDRVLRRRALLVSGVAAVLSAVAVVAVSTERLEEGRLVRHMVIGLLPYIEFTSVVPVWRVTAIAGLIAASLIVVSTRRGVGTFVAIGLVAIAAGVGLERANPVVQRRANRLQAASDVATLRDGVLPPGVPFLFDLDPLVDGERRMYYQFYLPDNRMYALSDRDRAAPTPYVFAPLDDPDVADGELLWTDPAVPIGLYRVPFSD